MAAGQGCGPAGRASRRTVSGQEPAAAEIAPGLYVVSTPIGNLGDLTGRAEEVLRRADFVACEDTRHTGLLLHRLGIEGRLVSYHDHNKLRRTPEVLEMLRQGKRVALVSDAGTPGVSDPGFYLIRAAAASGIRIVPVPGASALLSALVVSGLPCDRFAFEGFLPRRDGRRRKRLQALATEPRTMVFFEPARRLVPLLREMLELWGDRDVVVGRELTKLHEEVIRGRLAGLVEELVKRDLRGEATVVVAGHAGTA
ncbi:MAG: 16S rRNA (cytidine(1402)-2'-O)-methyltransferase [bacterium]